MDYNTSILTINKYIEKPDKIIELIENFYNFTRGLEVYVGLIAIVSAIYIYCIGFTDTFKKNILIFLMGEEKILLILVSILLFYFFNIPSIYFISLTIILFYFLYRAIELIFLVMNHKKLEEVFSTEIVSKFKKLENGNGLNNLYQEIQVNLYQAIVDRNLIRVEELLTFLKEFLLFQENENKKISSERVEEPEDKLIPFFYKCYKFLIEAPDINILLALSNISIYLGDFYLERKDYKRAQACYSLIELNYEYYIKNYKEDIFLNIGSSLFSSLGNKNSEILEEALCYESALLKLIYKIIQIEDYKNLNEFMVFYDLEIYQENIYKKIKVYSCITIIYFLDNQKPNDEKERILKDLKDDIFYNVDSSFLENIFELEKEAQLEKKLELDDLKFPRFDFRGMSSYSSSADEIIKYVFIFLDELREDLTEEFVLKNYRSIERIADSYNLNFIKSQLKLHEIKIKIEKAKEEYNYKIAAQELQQFLEKIKKEERELKVFKILEEVSINLFQESKEIEEPSFMNFEILIPNYVINLDRFKTQILLNAEQNFEKILIEELKKKSKIYLTLNELTEGVLLISRNSYIKLNKEKISRDIKIYFFSDNIIDNNIGYFIKKEGIDKYFYKNLLDIKKLEQNDLEKIKGCSEEEKKIKFEGMSKLIIKLNLNIKFNDKKDTYIISDIADYLKK
ncbi:MAG: hypothetical protein ACRC51_00390 [Cetobacterium sp.]